jgi:uncharacterized membrane protein (UPF0127 family)
MVLVKHGGEKIMVPAKKVPLSSAGLILRTRNTANLLFENPGGENFDLTSWFVFFPFLVLWLDGKNNVVDSRIARPFEARIKSRRAFSRVLEVPVNERNREIIDFFVGGKK